MKRLLALLLTVVFCFGFGFTAFAEEADDLSQPRLMVTGYRVDGASIIPSAKRTLEINFKNYSKTKQLKNIKLTISDDSGELNIDGTGTAYVEKINKEGTYTWRLSVSAGDKAQTGNHRLSVNAEFEDNNGEAYSSSDSINVYVKGNPQEAEPDASQPRLIVTGYKVDGGKLLPSKKTKASVTIKNFSKAKAVYNVKLTLSDETGEVKPNGAGSVIVEKIGAGSSYTYSFYVTAARTAQTGVHRLSLNADYEDANGNVFSCGDSISVNVKGTAEAGEENQNASQPRVMVTNYFVNGGYIQPSKSADMEITIKNFNKKRAISNIKLTISDDSGEIETEGMPSVYVDKIAAGGKYVWKLSLKALHNAQLGEHKLNVSCEYEDDKFQTYSAADTLIVKVKQSVGLDYSGLELSPKVIQGDTETISITVMNTGKTNLSNCKIDFDVKGLTDGGTLFIGEVPAGESKDASANLRVSSDILGEIEGTATLYYEDAYGEAHTEVVKLSSIIEERMELVDEEEEEKQSKYPLWWLFLILGLLFGGGVGCAVPIAINNSKQRKEDELRL